MRTRLVRLTIGMLLATALTACGDDADDAAPTTGPPDVTTTETTSTAPDGTTTTTPRGADLGEEPPFHDDGPSGSGCTPGDDVGLPDGWWYGTVSTSIAEAIDFDLACYHTGASAEAAAASRGDEVNNDYYVVDDNPSRRSLPVAGDATASCVELDDGLRMVDCDPADVTGEWAVWIRVVGGVVDRVVEQYAP